ncbi:response regulator transcription factor [Clostridium sp. ZS2-4]|uniref:response regulator transcription factor n=1 Tax=Clostridium sp. ZS2-4 TaxID=2987703 RepID=UPI00227AA64E|nr:response regulator transcription factor [Clostridium sp. ZS2-4]MCY6355543.1 response regulator transcription factor [Clostridium sp. ZS2-4]
MTMEKNILVVDDEKKIVEVVKSYLEKDGYNVFEAYSGKDAIEIFEENNISLIILDLMLPDLSGEEICKTLRGKSRVPIIMLTAKVKEENILGGFNIGADDYVTKPFSPKQLVARVMALLRRTESGLTSDIMIFNNGHLVIDDLKHEVRKNSEIVNLTATEYKLLLTMAKYTQKAFTREELVCMVLGEDYDGFDRVIDTHVKNLRHKIEDNTREPEYILTIHGIGYKFGGE